jgi:protein-tyrosine-phosphatase
MLETNLDPTNNIDEPNINAENKVSEAIELAETHATASVDATPDAPEAEAFDPTQSNETIADEKMTAITEAAIIEEIEEIEEASEIPSFGEDFTHFTKKDFVNLADKMLESLAARQLSSADVKNIDNVIKVIRPAFEEIVATEKRATKKAYVEQNGSEEGFEFKNDNHAIRFEGLMIQIREKKQAFFNKLEREREDYFEIKTRLLQQLREIVDTEEKGESKNNWEAFKQLQTAWKNAGNVNSPHNGTLWSGYNALVDRYFDIRSIQNELKDLDKKKNIITKEGIVIKIETIARSLEESPLSNVVLKKANDLLNDYKQVGPGPREEQDALWDRLKKAFDIIYEKKRELSKENQTLLADTYQAKNQIFESLKPYLEFQSDSINEWNAKSKEVMAIQEQWNAIKGAMPRDKGKDISKDFWAALKQFFKNKSDFFAKLEAKREANYKAKEILCLEADEILAMGDHSAPNTNKIIDLQKRWKTIGHVPEKHKDTLYNRFKATCDQYFDLKRNENKVQDEEFSQNLVKKEAICVEIENLAASGAGDMAKLSEYKKAFGAVGFVPRKDMQNIQERFIKAINNFVKSASGLNKSEKDKLMLQNEVDVVLKTGGASKNLDKQEGDIRRRIKSLEEEISLTRNNMEFFGFSKNAEKLKEEYMKKVEKGEHELKELQDKLRLIVAAN